MMHRRHLLTGAAALALQMPGWMGLATRAVGATGAARPMARVRQTDPIWPNEKKWEALNKAASGNLSKGQALFGACVAEPRGAACGEVNANIHNPFFIGDQAGGTQVSGWLDAWRPQPSAYVVAARSSADVAAAVNFARENNLRLVVKGAGHSYLGTSCAPDSLLIWLRHMNSVTMHDAFVPAGCKGRVAPVPAVSLEAGAVWIDAYHAVTIEGGRYVQGGGCTDVGVAGLVQSGGFGSLSKGFGSAAAWLIEAEIVTADGRVRVVNASQDPELLWALKGGGGGSWGVVTRLTLQTHDLPQYFGWAGGRIQTKSDAAFRRLIARFVAFYSEHLFNPHWGEQASIGDDKSLKISMVSQGLDEAQAKATWQPFFDWVSAAGADYTLQRPLRTGAGTARDWWKIDGNDSMIRDTRAGAADYHGWWRGDGDQVGVFLHGYDSLWLPASLLEPARQQVLVDALISASRHKSVGLHFNKGLAGGSADALSAARQTATNPAVLSACALVIIADGEAPAYPYSSHPNFDEAAARADAKKIDAAAAELRKIAPRSGSYISESNFFNRDWQHDYWGENYPRLSAVKAKYDPDGLFFVHHGVGSEAWSGDGFARLTSR
jgi:FAD/FMN-containing dehydrogenase